MDTLYQEKHKVTWRKAEVTWTTPVTAAWQYFCRITVVIYFGLVYYLLCRNSFML